jgi:ubiquitin C-terminal hydrolase
MSAASPLNTISDIATALPDSDNAGRIGLCNLGNTCYMNSVIQCLAHLPEFTTYVRSRQYIKDMDTTIKRYLREKNIPITEEAMVAIRDRSTSYRLYMLISCMWQNGGRIRPRTLHETLCREQTELSARTPAAQMKVFQFNKFSRLRQEDAPDMFTHIIDRIHCELTVCKRVVYTNPDPAMLSAKNRHDDYLAIVADPSST